MKKEIIKLPNKRVNFLPAHRSVRLGNIVGAGCFESEGGDSPKDSPKDDKRTEEQLFEAIDKRMTNLLANRATKEELHAIRTELRTEFAGVNIEALREMADDKTGVMSILANQGLEIKRIKEAQTRAPKIITIRSQCEDFLNNKENIAAIRAGKKVDFNINFRAAADSPMTPSTVMPGGTNFITRYEVQPGINELLRPEPTFWTTIIKGTTNAETYVWLNKKPTSGAAGWIGPGEYKPAISFTVDTENSHAKKIAVNEKMAMELLDDIDGFENWVTTELKYQLDQKTNDVLQGNGAADSKTPEGLQHMSLAYNAATGIKTTNTTFWDCLAAMVGMLRVTRFRGPILMFVNPVDYINGLITKAQSQGQLFIPPPIGATVVEDLNMPLGYVQAVATDYYKLLIYRDFTIKWGLENDDLTKNLSTVIGERRVHQFFSENYNDRTTMSFALYDSIETIKTAITAV